MPRDSPFLLRVDAAIGLGLFLAVWASFPLPVWARITLLMLAYGGWGVLSLRHDWLSLSHPSVVPAFPEDDPEDDPEASPEDYAKDYPVDTAPQCQLVDAARRDAQYTMTLEEIEACLGLPEEFCLAVVSTMVANGLITDVMMNEATRALGYVFATPNNASTCACSYDSRGE